MLDDPCVGCEQAEATTTCGAPEHPCHLCQWCRDSLDGREYDDEPDESLDDCSACDAPLDSCSPGSACCDDCTHSANFAAPSNHTDRSPE